jgi:hypothetical protein
MAKRDKLIERMRNNPLDWRIEDLQSIADDFGIPYRQHGTSHVYFYAASKQGLSVPAHRPIKPVYIKQFLKMLDEVKHEGQ